MNAREARERKTPGREEDYCMSNSIHSNSQITVRLCSCPPYVCARARKCMKTFDQGTYQRYHGNPGPS